jgi:hypothetical protein
MSYPTGLGIEACGRAVYGNSYSEYEPRYEVSRPVDKSKNNPRDVVLKFTTYSFSSWLASTACVIEISEDSGATYAVAYNGTAFLAPYNDALSKVRRPDSQRLDFYVQKTSQWPIKKKIYVQLTAVDDFGDAVTKTLPVKWC